MTHFSSQDILAQLVAVPSISRSSNLAILDYIEALLVPLGARAKRYAHPSGNRANLWLQIGPDVAGGIILSGHSDVVPVEGQNWASDPFVLRESEGRLYGRGTADMKGFLACAIAMMIKAASRPLTRPIYLAVSYDEEIGCVGVRAMIEALAGEATLSPALCIIGEPTGMRIATGHKGKRALRASCTGLAAHSALAPTGLNALHLGAKFIDLLVDVQADIMAHHPQDHSYDVPYTTVHAGVMAGGRALNIVPDHCEIDFEIRNIAQDDPQAIIAKIKAGAEDIIAPQRARFPTAAITIDEVNGYPGLDMAQDGDAVRLLRQFLRDDQEAIKVAFGTEAGLFVEGLGVASLVCGPGLMDQGHKPDEYISQAQLALCEAMLDEVLAYSCGD